MLVNDIYFSIIIPLYNKEKSIINTLQSVLSQSYLNFEIIIIDDGSTDNSLEVVKSINDDKIRVISTPNAGVSGARNYGVTLAKYSYIVFLDADDLWYPNALSEFKTLIEMFPESNVHCTSHTLSIKNISSKEKRYLVSDFYRATAESYASNSTALLCTGCVALEIECFHQIGGYDVFLTHGEDLDLWARLADRYLFSKSEVVTMKYRLDAENRSDKSKKSCGSNVIFINRQSIESSSLQLDYGRKYFFEIVNGFSSRSNWINNVKLIVNYGDWILRFAILLIKLRVKNKF